MKPRTVMVFIEGESAAPLKEIKKNFIGEHGWYGTDSFRVKQVSVQVAQPARKKR